MHDIKKVGTFEATVHFFKDVEVKLPVTVVAEEEPKQAEAEAEPKAEAPEAAPEAENAETEAASEDEAPAEA